MIEVVLGLTAGGGLTLLAAFIAAKIRGTPRANKPGVAKYKNPKPDPDLSQFYDVFKEEDLAFIGDNFQLAGGVFPSDELRRRMEVGAVDFEKMLAMKIAAAEKQQARQLKAMEENRALRKKLEEERDLRLIAELEKDHEVETTTFSTLKGLSKTMVTSVIPRDGEICMCDICVRKR